MNTYIAGPLFNPEQINTIKEIETLLDDRRDSYFSPREFGVISNEPMTPERMERIFKMNIFMLQECETIIAILDDRDSGTIFELGVAFAMDKNIITYSAQGHGINVMLKHAVRFHCNGMEELENALNGHGTNTLEVIE